MAKSIREIVLGKNSRIRADFANITFDMYSVDVDRAVDYQWVYV